MEAFGFIDKRNLSLFSHWQPKYFKWILYFLKVKITSKTLEIVNISYFIRGFQLILEVKTEKKITTCLSMELTISNIDQVII